VAWTQSWDLCAHVAIVREGKNAGTYGEGPEYETIWSFGPQCGVSNGETIARAGYLCDYYGLDTISVGNTIGFLMECYEKGLITSEDTGGIDLRFGDAHAMVAAADLAGQGVGKLAELVSNGVRKAVEQIGRGSEKFAIHSKGLELPAYCPRAGQGMGLNLQLVTGALATFRHGRLALRCFSLHRRIRGRLKAKLNQ